MLEFLVSVAEVSSFFFSEDHTFAEVKFLYVFRFSLEPSHL